MGFFSDIIHDSRRQSTMPEQRSSAGLSFPADALTRSSEGTSSEEGVSLSEMMSESQLWEEGGRLAGKASQMTPPQGPVTRQVVDLLPPENTAVAEFPVATGLLSTLPNPGKQDLAGSESARTGTTAQGTEQESASSDSVFANVCFVSAVGDSQVKEPLSLRQAHSTGNMSVETQGRRQAGTDTRAGSATPPNPSLAQAVEMKPAGSPAPAWEKPVMPEKQGPAIPEDPLRQEQLQQGDRPVHNLSFISAPGQILAADLSGKVLTPTPSFSRKDSAEKKARKPQVSPGIEGSYDVVPGNMEPRKNRPDKGETLPFAEVVLSEVPPRAQMGNNYDVKAQQTTSPPVKQNSEPQVQIGLLEVVVVSPGQGAGATGSKENTSSNLASRLYLRGL